ncbi:MAG: hypothetical protein WEC00_02905, partial [Dongiaceae bacterium]
MNWRCMLPAAALLLSASTMPGFAQDTDETVDPEQARIEEIVREYLLAHPEVVVEALQAYETQRMAVQQAQQQEV